MQKVWTEDTPKSLLKNWHGQVMKANLHQYFKKELDNFGNFTNRIEYNPIFKKTNQGGDKSCCESKWLVQNTEEHDMPNKIIPKTMTKGPRNITIDRFFLTPHPNWKLVVGIKTFVLVLILFPNELKKQLPK